MRIINNSSKKSPWRRFPTAGSVALLLLLLGLLAFLLSAAGLSVAESNQDTFPSAEKATAALFAAVQGNNEEAIMQVLGGGKDLVSAGDSLDDQHDRELFVEKYRQMHRLVEEPDGTTLLYIGAENWPFTVPLVSKGGKWYFDADAGSKEVLFRRVGENEASTIEVCQRLATMAKKGSDGEANSDDAAVQYARTLIDADVVGSGGRPANQQQSSEPLHGYYFGKLKNGKARTESFIVVAYPAEYRSSGVMTFVVAATGVVYEKDLGAQTRTLAKAMTTWKPDRRWQVVK
ncbi:MAG TPA: DUF2950 family protein [Terriglobales bacterium]|nr:DUF2950 family protein [Terriglobales bacterium]